MTAVHHLEATIKRAVTALVEALDPEQVILFGSAARGEFGPNSDLDFLVVLHVGKDTFPLHAKAQRALWDIDALIDVLFTTPERFSARKTIIGTIEEPAHREGKVVYARA